MQFEYLGAFKEGEDVPTWLMDADPLKAGPSMRMRFNIDCHVIKTTDAIWIVNDRLEGKPQIFIAIDASSEAGKRDGLARALGPSGRVIMPYKFTIWSKDEGDDGRFDSTPSPIDGAGQPLIEVD
jgi:hypothetical protein